MSPEEAQQELTRRADAIEGGYEMMLAYAAQGYTVAALDVRAEETALVANEVGLGIVPDNALARRFRDAQGTLNRRIAQRADCVVFMVAGLPMKLKD